jgi:hypothetical protein
MKKENKSPNPLNPKLFNKKEDDTEGYPLYPADEDVYNHSKRDASFNPENASGNVKTESGYPEKRNEKDFEDDVTGDDLDIPGSELDDEQEETGNEDEENNYYSIGGDRHDDLDEDKDDYQN